MARKRGSTGRGNNGPRGDVISRLRTQAFALAIAEGKAANEAAEAAGYTGSSNSRSTVAHRLMKRPEVKDAIEEARAKMTDATVARGLERRQMLSRIIRGELEAAGPMGKPTKPSHMAMIQAAKLLAQMDGELKGDVAVNIGVNVGDRPGGQFAVVAMPEAIPGVSAWRDMVQGMLAKEAQDVTVRPGGA